MERCREEEIDKTERVIADSWKKRKTGIEEEEE